MAGKKPLEAIPLEQKYWNCIHGIPVRDPCMYCEEQLQLDLNKRMDPPNGE